MISYAEERLTNSDDVSEPGTIEFEALYKPDGTDQHATAAQPDLIRHIPYVLSSTLARLLHGGSKHGSTAQSSATNNRTRDIRFKTVECR
jgi:hypothetical protein